MFNGLFNDKDLKKDIENLKEVVRSTLNVVSRLTLVADSNSTLLSSNERSVNTILDELRSVRRTVENIEASQVRSYDFQNLKDTVNGNTREISSIKALLNEQEVNNKKTQELLKTIIEEKTQQIKSLKEREVDQQQNQNILMKHLDFIQTINFQKKVDIPRVDQREEELEELSKKRKELEDAEEISPKKAKQTNTPKSELINGLIYVYIQTFKLDIETFLKSSEAKEKLKALFKLENSFGQRQETIKKFEFTEKEFNMVLDYYKSITSEERVNSAIQKYLHDILKNKFNNKLVPLLFYHVHTIKVSSGSNARLKTLINSFLDDTLQIQEFITKFKLDEPEKKLQVCSIFKDDKRAPKVEKIFPKKKSEKSNDEKAKIKKKLAEMYELAIVAITKYLFEC